MAQGLDRSMTPPTRRHFLGSAATAAALASGTARAAQQQEVTPSPGKRPRVAALASVYFYLSHAYHIVGRFLDGFPVYPVDGSSPTSADAHHQPPFEIASLYIEQTAAPCRTWAGPRLRGTAFAFARPLPMP